MSVTFLTNKDGDALKQLINAKGTGTLTFTGGAEGSYNGTTDVTINIPSGMTVDDVLALINTSTDVPTYVTAEAERVAEAINGVRTAKSLVLLCASDIHTLMSYTPNVTATLHLAQGMNEICKRVTVDGVVNLGDTVWGDSTSTIQNCKDEYNHLRNHLGNVQGVPQIWLQGNHDNNAYNSAETLNTDQLYSYIGANTTDKAVTDYDNLHRLYGYVDYERQKIRVIYLNTTDSGDAPSTSYSVSTAQAQWLVDTLAAVPGGWGVVAMSHHPLNTSGGTNTVILTILDAYKGKQSGSANSVSYDFASAQGEMICHLHGHIHNYQAQTFGTNGVLSITIPNGCFGRNNEYGTGGNTAWGDTDSSGNQRVFAKTSGTAEDTAYTAVVIDRANGVVHALRCGAGIDRTLAYNSSAEMFSVTMFLNNVSSSNGSTRVVSGMPYTTTLTANTGYALDVVEVYMGATDITATAYANGKITITEVTGAIIFRATVVVSDSGDTGDDDTTVNYTNRVPTSINNDGTIYNSTGYKNGYRLSSSTGGEAAEATCVVSGFIPYNGEVIRVWGSTKDNLGSTGNYIGLYDSNFSKLYVLAGTGATDNGATWVAVDGKYMLTVYPEAITNEIIKGHLDSAKYIRVSVANATGDAFAVTLDEEISDANGVATLSVDDEGNGYLEGMAVDDDGNATLPGYTPSVDGDGDATVE